MRASESVVCVCVCEREREGGRERERERNMWERVWSGVSVCAHRGAHPADMSQRYNMTEEDSLASGDPPPPSPPPYGPSTSALGKTKLESTTGSSVRKADRTVLVIRQRQEVSAYCKEIG